MMIDQNTLDHLAKLARLTVPDSEKEQLARDFSNIVAFIDTIQKIELSSMDESFLKKNVIREDVVNPLGSAYDLVEVAPMHKDGFVQVPKVIE